MQRNDSVQHCDLNCIQTHEWFLFVFRLMLLRRNSSKRSSEQLETVSVRCFCCETDGRSRQHVINVVPQKVHSVQSVVNLDLETVPPLMTCELEYYSVSRGWNCPQEPNTRIQEVMKPRVLVLLCGAGEVGWGGGGDLTPAPHPLSWES